MTVKKTKRKRKIKRKNKYILKKKYITLIISLILFLISFFGEKYNLGQKGKPSEDTYKVLYVSDGDTVVVEDHGDKRKLRLYGIDAPEKTQEYGLESKEYLHRKINGKYIHIDFISKDRYGRDISIIYLDNENINELMVREGYAWWYKDYAKNDLKYMNNEKKAREEKKGLWSKKNPVPPWDYRKIKKDKNKNN